MHSITLRFFQVLSRTSGRLGAALLLSVFLASCGGGGGSSDSSTQGTSGSSSYYFPLAKGNLWRYQNDGAQWNATVTTTQVVDGLSGFTLSESNTIQNSSVYVQKSDGLYVYPDGSDDSYAKALGSFMVLKNSSAAGDSFVQIDKTITTEDLDGDNRPDPTVIHSVITVIGLESIDVPAGSFPDCLHQRTALTTKITLSTTGATVTQNTTYDEWYAPGVGLVRGVSTSGNAASTTTVLTGYRVGSRSTDSTPPTVVSVTPTAGSVTGIYTNIGVSFSEPMDPSTLDDATLTLTDSHGQQVLGYLQKNTQSLTFMLAQALPGDTYTVHLAATGTDLLGNALTGPKTWQFTVDSIKPSLLSSSPAADAKDVSLSSLITLQFSKPIDPKSVTPYSVQLQQAGSPVDTTISVKGSTITITPVVPLSRQAGYSVYVSGTVTDAVGNTLGSSISYYFQTDQGLFSAATPISTGISVNAMAIGDVNGDGINDLVFTSSVADQSSDEFALFVRLGQPDGTLGAQTRVSSGRFMSCWIGTIAIGEFNGDGPNDVAVGGCGVQLFMQNSSGALVMGNFLNKGESMAMRAADIDGDGRTDLITGSPGSGTLYIWRQDSSGQLVLAGTPNVDPTGATGVRDLEIGDLNGDHRQDIIFTSNGASTVGVMYQQPDGSFSAPVNTPDNSNFGPGALALGDLNGDGRTDVVISGGGNSPAFIRVRYQNADGTLGPLIPITTYDIPSAVRVADINNDGRADIVVSHAGWNTVGVYLQGSDGTLAPEVKFTASADGAMLVGDINRDGKPDILLGNMSGASLMLQKTPAKTIATGAHARMQALLLSRPKQALAPVNFRR